MQAPPGFVTAYVVGLTGLVLGLAIARTQAPETPPTLPDGVVRERR